MKTLLLLSIPLCVLLSSCSSTPTQRIEKNPAIYADLSPSHQKLVSEGKITKGMTKPAVFLAMGRPDQKIAGNTDGKDFERWDYNVLTPTYHTGFSSYYGHGFGHRGGFRRRGFRGGSRYGIGFHPSLSYVPRRGASVGFTTGKVSSWSVAR